MRLSIKMHCNMTHRTSSRWQIPAWDRSEELDAMW